MKKVTLGGDTRINSGKKMKVEINGFERSTANKSYKWTSSMSSGTIVPCLKQLLTPGATFDIEVDLAGYTLPTLGPMFSSYDIYVEAYFSPLRLFNNLLMMNLTGQGLKMNEVLFPQLKIYGDDLTGEENPDNMQVNSSHILKYLGIRGIGSNAEGTTTNIWREFNAIPYLIYFDVFRNYYANLQEEIGYIIHNDMEGINTDITSLTLTPVVITNPVSSDTFYNLTEADTQNSAVILKISSSTVLTAECTDLEEFDTNRIQLWIGGSGGSYVSPNEIFENLEWNFSTQEIIWSTPKGIYADPDLEIPLGYFTFDTNFGEANSIEPKLVEFPLSAIDDMRKTILRSETGTAPTLSGITPSEPWFIPYGLPLMQTLTTPITKNALLNTQEGLLVCTYPSDKHTTWVNTEWIDGDNGVNAVTAVNVVNDKVLLNEINVKQRIYRMLMNIGTTGGDLDAWQDAVYDHKRPQLPHQPIYVGGLKKALTFNEVISNSATETDGSNQPLGTLAGIGRVGHKKGGKFIVRADEHGYLTAYVRIVPRPSYYQGNDWDNNLKNIDQIHKPDLDQIAFEDVITDEMAFFDTQIDDTGTITYKSAGKRPAWTNYITEVNQVYGTFADINQQAFMVILRRFENDVTSSTAKIKNLTTYIDPTQQNYAFADTRLDAQNYWIDLGWTIIARQKKSAKVMPNLR